MKRRFFSFLLATITVSSVLSAAQTPSVGDQKRGVIIPDTGLMKCRLGECATMWSTVGTKLGAVGPWRVTIERLGEDPCPNGIIALYDESVSMEELEAAVSARYGPAYLKGAASGGTWNDETNKAVINLASLADEASPDTHLPADTPQQDPAHFFATEAFHDSVGRSMPRKHLKELTILSKFGYSCGVQKSEHK